MSTDVNQDSGSTGQALGKLVLDRDFERMEGLLAEFNLFDVLGIARRESQHSAFLAWLLNPRGSHGLRDYFLRHFLSQAADEAHKRGINAPTRLDVDGWSLSNVNVETERHGIDVLVIGESDEFVCLVENKIGSSEHSDQLTRYLYVAEHEYKGLTPLPVFLTPEGTDPRANVDMERYVPFDYGKVATLIERALSTCNSTISASVANFLEQYVHNLRRHILHTTDNIDALAYQLYYDHRSAIDRIVKAKSIPLKMTNKIVSSVAKSYEPQLHYDTRSYSSGVHILHSPHLDEIGALIVAVGSMSTPTRTVFFKFVAKNERLTLCLTVEGNCPLETRQRLHELTQMRLGPWYLESELKQSRSFVLYQKPILSQQDYHPFDADAVREKIEAAAREFYENDYWWLVNDIRQEFGYPPVNSPE